MVKLSEQEWGACRTDPATMLEHLGNSGCHTTRKFRLFCCAAARRAARYAELNVTHLIRIGGRVTIDRVTWHQSGCNRIALRA